MHQFCSVSQSTESFLAEAGSHFDFPDGLRSQLVCLTQNQAVLLGEFQDGDLHRLALESPASFLNDFVGCYQVNKVIIVI